ncbi:TetR/AcrR family transcriptional regulator [Paludibacterium yongneupense]|uniref:TetR/AcrR family transcriptional regulator n=1 Tax=Paludibacterium yongneupense TaxID=400061 RepID=UPI0003F90D27|nr:TetR/AcrR family transcriptional regulator [Paludibacterium yongneupense]
MTSTRLSRAGQRELTRQNLFDAMLKQIVARGYSALTIDDIVCEAGYSRGAFYSNFASKRAMFIELLQRLDAEEEAALDALGIGQAGAMSSPEQVRTVFDARYRRRDVVLCRIEAWLLAGRDDAFRLQYGPRMHDTIAMLVDCFRTFCAQTGSQRGLAPEVLALALLGMGEGGYPGQQPDGGHGPVP